MLVHSCSPWGGRGGVCTLVVGLLQEALKYSLPTLCPGNSPFPSSGAEPETLPFLGTSLIYLFGHLKVSNGIASEHTQRPWVPMFRLLALQLFLHSLLATTSSSGSSCTISGLYKDRGTWR